MKGIVHRFLEAPRLNLDELPWRSPEGIKQIQKEYAVCMAEYLIQTEKIPIYLSEFYKKQLPILDIEVLAFDDPETVEAKQLVYESQVKKMLIKNVHGMLKIKYWLTFLSTEKIKKVINKLSPDGKSVFYTIFGILCFNLVLLIFGVKLNTFKENLFFHIRLIMEICFFTALLVLTVFISRIRAKKKLGKVFAIWWCVAILIGSFHVPRLLNIGNTQIGSFYELPEYKENYMVIMSRKPNTEKNRKQYTLPAEIEKLPMYAGQKVSINVYSGERETTEMYSSGYCINYLYFNNGGHLYFEGDDYQNALILNEEVKIEDYRGDTYYITLTDKKAKK